MRREIILSTIFVLSFSVYGQEGGKNLLLEYYKNKQGVNNSSFKKDVNGKKQQVLGKNKAIQPKAKNKNEETMNSTSTNFFNALTEGKSGISQAIEQMYGRGDASFNNPGYSDQQDINQSLNKFLVGDDKLGFYKMVSEDSFVKGNKIIRTYFAQTKKGRQAYFRLHYLNAGLKDQDMLLLRVEMRNYSKGPNE